MHDQQAGMICLVADLRELRKAQNQACVTTAPEQKCAICYLQHRWAERGRKREGGGRNSMWTPATHHLPLLLLWELERRNSDPNLYVPDISHQEITN